MLADCTLKQRPANLPSYIHKKAIFITIQIIHSKSNVCLKTSHKFYNNHKKYCSKSEGTTIQENNPIIAIYEQAAPFFLVQTRYWYSSSSGC